MSISDDARQYVKDHKKELCEKFANLSDFPPVENPSAYFMAGSPGAGKTEYSKSLIELLHKKDPNRKIVRIDNTDSYLKIKYTPQDLGNRLESQT